LLSLILDNHHHLKRRRHNVENNYSLAGKVIVVTGGTGILGKSFIDGIVAAGGAVGILGRNKEIAEERAAEINKNGGKAIALVADVLNVEELTAAKDKVWAEFGRLDGLVNAAGGNMPEGVLAARAGYLQHEYGRYETRNRSKPLGHADPNPGFWRADCQNWQRQYRKYLVHEL
jgi:NAD(P)-dependent dehydrogenase (short-subunit alcohol dehydrogenase family)